MQLITLWPWWTVSSVWEAVFTVYYWRAFFKTFVQKSLLVDKQYCITLRDKSFSRFNLSTQLIVRCREDTQQELAQIISDTIRKCVCPYIQIHSNFSLLNVPLHCLSVAIQCELEGVTQRDISVLNVTTAALLFPVLRPLPEWTGLMCEPVYESLSCPLWLQPFFRTIWWTIFFDRSILLIRDTEQNCSFHYYCLSNTFSPRWD